VLWIIVALHVWRGISSVRKFPSEDAKKTLVCFLVLSRLDYCNSLEPDHPIALIRNLQKVHYAVVRIIKKLLRISHHPSSPRVTLIIYIQYNQLQNRFSITYSISSVSRHRNCPIESSQWSTLCNRCFWVYQQHLIPSTIKNFSIVFDKEFGFGETVLYFLSHLKNRTQTVDIHGNTQI